MVDLGLSADFPANLIILIHSDPFFPEEQLAYLEIPAAHGHIQHGRITLRIQAETAWNKPRVMVMEVPGGSCFFSQKEHNFEVGQTITHLKGCWGPRIEWQEPAYVIYMVSCQMLINPRQYYFISDIIAIYCDHDKSKG